MNILTLNCGSSSVKYSLWKTPGFRKISGGIIERIGLEGSFIEHQADRSPPVVLERPVADHSEAISLLLELGESPPPDRKGFEIDVVAHRIVHGGERLVQSTIIDEEVKAEILRCVELAPLHNPPNLVGIESAMKLLPRIPHVGVFDTAFFVTMPPHVYTYAIPKQWAQSYRIRRFGFHGASHLYVSRRTAVHLGRPPSNVNVITLHIGNGVSITAVKQGLAFDHSMGFTPLEGAVMGTRCGDIDPAIPLYLMEKLSLSPEEMLDVLNRRSGLLGITRRYSDRRDILKGIDSGDGDCKLAFELECYRLRKYIGAYMAALGEVDAITFTGGAGERSPRYREAICSGLEQLSIKIDEDRNNRASGNIESIISSDASKIKIYAIPTDEERVYAEDAAALLEGRYEPYWKYKYSFESNSIG